MDTSSLVGSLPALSENTRALRRSQGAFYTPAELAFWVAGLALENQTALNPLIVDFGCGDGELLVAAASLSPTSRLFGIDVDPIAVKRASLRLPLGSVIKTNDILAPLQLNRQVVLADSWLDEMGGAADVVILNPPWGAVQTTTRAELLAAGLDTATGQYDTYDLFCELALKILKPGGTFAFIVPDSILLPEHKPLRKILLAHELSVIARLGEGIFQNVFRGCVVISGKNQPPNENHSVECLRLTKENRLSAFSGTSFAALREQKAHFVPQIRFAGDPEFKFDLDVTVDDLTVNKVRSLGASWTNRVHSRRGVEISKHGRVLMCADCGTSRPLPKADHALCLNCGQLLLRKRENSVVAEKPTGSGNWQRLIVGEDVLRYSAIPSRWIKCDVRGINYKQKAPTGTPRILIRKTGVGINAALDLSGAYTNQVVFEYTTNTAPADFSYLHYILGVLNSRVLFAYHLKSAGEIEWRSHPYVTQNTLASLPVPEPARGSPMWKQAREIASAVEDHLRTGEQDLRIEALVAGLYGLEKADLIWTMNVIDSAADLEPMRRLRLPMASIPDPIFV